MKRTPIGKRKRFSIFARDNFTCRYCGRQSDEVVLHIDHVIPVAKGGTNDDENLVTSCEACNLGKSDSGIDQAAPSETDRLRIAQEMNEQVEAARKATLASQARSERRQNLVDFWCGESGRTTADRPTISTIFSYVQEFGEEVVFGWIEKAAVKCRTDRAMGQYISGIRRLVLAEQQEQ